jgi:hypothetical protein
LDTATLVLIKKAANLKINIIRPTQFTLAPKQQNFKSVFRYDVKVKEHALTKVKIHALKSDNRERKNGR